MFINIIIMYMLCYVGKINAILLLLLFNTFFRYYAERNAKTRKITTMRKLLLKFNFNVSIVENGYENDYTTVGKQLKSYVNCCFSVQYDTVY